MQEELHRKSADVRTTIRIVSLLALSDETDIDGGRLEVDSNVAYMPDPRKGARLSYTPSKPSSIPVKLAHVSALSFTSR